MAFLRLMGGGLAPHTLTEGGRTTAAIPLGTKAVDNAGKFYQYVKNTSTQAINQYEVCCFVSMADFTVTTDAATWKAYLPAGVYGESTAIAASEFFWLQYSGYALVDSETISTAAAGDFLIGHASADGETAEVTYVSTSLISAASISKIVGIVLAAETAGTPDTTPIMLRIWR